MDFVILVDDSASIGTDNWPFVLNLTTALVNALDQYSPVGDQSRVSIYTYSSFTRQHVSFDQNWNGLEIEEFVVNGGIEYSSGRTNMFPAVEEARDYLASNIRATSIGDNINVEQVMVLFTDGFPTGVCNDVMCQSPQSSIDDVLGVLANLMDIGTYVFMIGMLV